MCVCSCVVAWITSWSHVEIYWSYSMVSCTCDWTNGNPTQESRKIGSDVDLWSPIDHIATSIRQGRVYFWLSHPKLVASSVLTSRRTFACLRDSFIFVRDGGRDTAASPRHWCFALSTWFTGLLQARAANRNSRSESPFRTAHVGGTLHAVFLYAMAGVISKFCLTHGERKSLTYNTILMGWTNTLVTLLVLCLENAAWSSREWMAIYLHLCYSVRQCMHWPRFYTFRGKDPDLCRWRRIDTCCWGRKG